MVSWLFSLFKRSRKDASFLAADFFCALVGRCFFRISVGLSTSLHFLVSSGMRLSGSLAVSFIVLVAKEIEAERTPGWRFTSFSSLTAQAAQSRVGIS